MLLFIDQTNDRILMNRLNYTIINNLSYKDYFMADRGYYKNEIINALSDKGFESLIAQNIRNIKNKTLIQKMTKMKN